MMNMVRKTAPGLLTLAMLLLSGLLLPARALPAGAQAAAPPTPPVAGHTFPETGHTVTGVFWQYWQSHGGLAQQGYPISEQLAETSAIDGKPYTVQYFERSVFEYHPQNAGTPYAVLLTPLGRLRYTARYGAADAPGQTANQAPGASHFFAETGYWVGGDFWPYWQVHGGLPQQGYPLSNEFVETSALDGKPYTVQYFERAVFERHPLNAGTPFAVLLSQLGTYRYALLYGGAPPAGTPAPQPTAPPPLPPAAGAPCSALPAAQHGVVTPTCGPQGTLFQFTGSGFQPGEQVGVYYTWPDGSIHLPTGYSTADAGGQVTGVAFHTYQDTLPGVWAATMEGTQSHARAVGYFQVTPVLPAPPVPVAGGCDTSGDIDGQATPSSVRLGDTVLITAWGFTQKEPASVWFTSPQGAVVPAQRVHGDLQHADGTIGPLPIQTGLGAFGQAPGRWAISLQGLVSGHTSVVYFCLTR